MLRGIDVTAVLGIIALGIVSTVGCSMGANPHDCKYAAYGGLFDRVDRVNGRVGSVLDPAAVVEHTVDDIPPNEPTPAEPPEEGLEMEEPPEEPAAPREAQLDDGQEFIDVDHDGSKLELIEAYNTHDALHTQ